MIYEMPPKGIFILHIQGSDPLEEENNRLGQDMT